MSFRPVLRSALLLLLPSLAAVLSEARAAELLTLYEFDEADAAGFTDSTGLTTPDVVGGVSADAAGGFEGGAAEFNGVDIGLRLPIDINPAVNPNLTIGAWVRQNSFALGVHNAPWGHDDGGWDRGLDTGPDGATWGLSNGELFTTDILTSEADWQFVAVTYKGGATSLHVDDAPVFSIPGFAGSSVRTDLAVGSLNPATAIHPFNGWIDNFFVYDDVLTATQIEAIRMGGVAAIEATLDPPAGPRVLRQRWGFESGDLAGWSIVETLIGDNLVFESGGQPTNVGSSDGGFDYGSVQGDHFVRTWDGTNGTLGDLSDAHTGIIESESFVLEENANFDLRVGGGSWVFRGDPDVPEPDITAVTLERMVGPDDWEAIFAASGVGGRGGANGNVLRDAFWDASLYAGDTVRLRVYDTHQGGWGHIDVDDIRYTVTAEIDDPTDSDGDGMGDAWEIFFFGDLSRDGTGDFEGDDLSDRKEWDEGTLPNVADTDEDGLLDGPEVEDYGTSPVKADTDEDSWSDPDELARGTDPLDPDDFPLSGPRAIRKRWDFETGDLTGWTIVDTFIGDNTVFESGGQPTNINSSDAGFDYTSVQGTYFVRTWDGTNGTLGELSDAHTGIIESETFVLGPEATFDLLVGGGNHPFTGDPDDPAPDVTAVTLEREASPGDWEAIFSSTGPNANVLSPAMWDASLFEGETVRLRIYDTHQGGWGHIDVDNIRYAISADISDPTDSDGDGMGDAWEIFYFGDLSRDGTGDFEGDDLTDKGEWDEGTLPDVVDTDSDGLPDGDEVERGTSPLKQDTDDDTWSDPDEIARGTDPTDPNDFPMPPDGLWSVDIQAIDGPLFGQGVPVTMSGVEPNAGFISSVWNAFEVLGHDLTVIDPSMALVDAKGEPTPVTFTIFGVISGFTNPTGNVLTTDYAFVNAGNADPEATWEIANLAPGGIYDFYAYGGIARDMLLTVDANGNGSLLDDTPELVNAAGLLFDDVVAGGDGRIIGLLQPGTAGNAEANWGGFQLLQVSAPPMVDTDGDGLSDDDETNIYGTDRFNPDTDGDGQGDGAEVLAAGTDPTDATSVLRIISVDGGPGEMVTLTWTSVPGKTYSVEAATNVSGWTSLAMFPAAAAPAGTTTAVVETPDAGESRRQYRVSVTAGP